MAANTVVQSAWLRAKLLLRQSLVGVSCRGVFSPTCKRCRVRNGSVVMTLLCERLRLGDATDNVLARFPGSGRVVEKPDPQQKRATGRAVSATYIRVQQCRPIVKPYKPTRS